MIIRRKLFVKIEQFLESKQVIVVTGMRRVGKTTLLKYFYKKINFPNKIFLDLEDPLNRAIFEKKGYEAIKTALERRGVDFSKKSFIFLDEIQFTSTLPSVVKYFYDHWPVKFFLTGSASFYLKNLFSESLAGRKFLFELYPLDFEEFLEFKKISFRLPKFNEQIDKQTYELFAPLVEEYLFWGGMPEIVLLRDPKEREVALRDIFSSYFQKEIQTLGDFRKNEMVRDLILLLVRRIGQKIDIKRLSQEIGISRQTVYEYLDFLSGTYFISLVSALGKVDVAIRKQRKVYFIDSGFFSFLERPPTGSLFENVVYSSLRVLGRIAYFQKNNQEIDFILEIPQGEKIAFEVKETATASDIKKLKRRAKQLKIKKSFVVSLNFSQPKESKYLFQLVKFKTFL